MAATVKAWGIPELLDSFLNKVLKETEISTSSTLRKLPNEIKDAGWPKNYLANKKSWYWKQIENMHLTKPFCRQK